MKTVWCVVKIDTFGGGSDPVFFDKKKCAWDHIRKEAQKLVDKLGNSVIKKAQNREKAYLSITTKYTTWAWKGFEANLNLYDENNIPE